MRTLIKILFALLLLCGQAFADSTVVVVGQPTASAGPSCTTYSAQFTSVASTDAGLTVQTANAGGNGFKVTSTTYIYSITIYIYTETAETWTLRWGNSHDLTTYYKSATANSTIVGAQTIEFVLQDTSNQATAGTQYYFGVIKASAASGEMSRLNTGTYAGGGQLYPNSGWHTDDTGAPDADIRFIVNACTN